jgi:hypothetical protein
VDEMYLKAQEVALKRAELEIKILEYLDKSSESSWSSVRFVFGTFFLGLVGAALTFGSFIHTVEKDDLEYLERGKSIYSEADLDKRKNGLQMLIAIRKRNEPYLEEQLQLVKEEIGVRDRKRVEDARNAAVAKAQAENATSAALAKAIANAASAAADRVSAEQRRDQVETRVEELRREIREERINRRGMN